jgi:hypothetical protein
VMHPRQTYAALGAEFACGRADFDADGDVDLEDLANLQTCIGAAASGSCGAAFDLRVDDVLDWYDFSVFQGLTGGPDLPGACPG